MELTIDYSDIIKRCKLLSSYEAQSSKNASGDTMYPEVIMTDKEDVFIKLHLHEASRLIESRLNTCLDVIMHTSDASEEVVISFDDGYANDIHISTRQSFKQSLAETIVAFVMYQWLMNKVAERANAYNNLYEQMYEATRLLGLKKKRPGYSATGSGSSGSSSAQSYTIKVYNNTNAVIKIDGEELDAQTETLEVDGNKGDTAMIITAVAKEGYEITGWQIRTSATDDVGEIKSYKYGVGLRVPYESNYIIEVVTTSTSSATRPSGGDTEF